jgi:hypothetical protein
MKHDIQTPFKFLISNKKSKDIHIPKFYLSMGDSSILTKNRRDERREIEEAYVEDNEDSRGKFKTI